MKIKIDEHNIPYESKRDSKCPYWYIFKHGIGPGAVPDDVKIGKVKDLDNYYSIVWIDRPLSDKELKYYDIYPETMNNSILKNRLGYSEEDIDKLIKENTAIRHHIDNGYSIAKVNTNPIRINDLTLTIDKDIYEMEDSFWFDEEDNDNTGWGGVEFFGTARLTDDFDNYVDFKWWFNVSLVGDEYDENKIYIEIDNSLIASDLFTYEVEVENGLDEDTIYDNDYDIGEAIFTIIENNCDLFGYSSIN